MKIYRKFYGTNLEIGKLFRSFADMKQLFFLLFLCVSTYAQPKAKLGWSHDKFVEEYSAYEFSKNTDTSCIIPRFKIFDVTGTWHIFFDKDSSRTALRSWYLISDYSAPNIKKMAGAMKKKYGMATKLYENSDDKIWWDAKDGKSRYTLDLSGDDEQLVFYLTTQ